MGLYQHIRAIWKRPKENLGALWKARLIEWRRDPVTLRIEYPTRLDRARSLGYRAKQGIFIVRQRVVRGGHKRPNITGGRRSKHNRQSMVGAKDYQRIAEERANRNYVNCEVLNSYYVAKDGRFAWYEIIMVDKSHPAIKADPTLGWIANGKQTKRAFRGLTSAGKKGRGLDKKGIGSEKTRPSIRANDGKGK